jgi:cysteine-rich repeat protein
MRTIRPNSCHCAGAQATQGLRLAVALLVVGSAALAACSPSTPGTVGEGSGGNPNPTGGSAGQAGGSSGAGGGPTVVIATPDGSVDLPQSTCGNGVLDGTEQCDDGNLESGDGCSRICQIESNYDCPQAGQPCRNLAVCGNGVVTSDESCDDGNTQSSDGCSADCKTVESGWQCRVPGKPCTPKCGDGILSGSEACDDGNSTSGDGCSVVCKIEAG